MKNILLVMTSIFLSFGVFADMQEGAGSCPDVVDGGRTLSCPAGSTMKGNKCMDDQGNEVDSKTGVIKK